jgi:hypothetical protein
MKVEHEHSGVPSYEITLRSIGQALGALGIKSFELILDGDSFVVYGASEPPASSQKSSTSRFQLFRGRTKRKPSHGFYISGMRFQESDIKRLDRQGKDVRVYAERCPDTNSLAHELRMIGAHIDKTGVTLLAVITNNGSFTVWHTSRSGREMKQIFTEANLYDLWVHLYRSALQEI